MTYDEKKQQLLNGLLEKFSDTKIEVRKKSPLKWDNESEMTLFIKYNGSKVCGMQIQKRTDAIKMWFYNNREWEIESDYPYKEPAKNGNGLGSGKGFYVNNIDDCIEETKAFLQKYYGF